jgi:deoxyadenosine/deoxycytidine kinase
MPVKVKPRPSKKTALKLKSKTTVKPSKQIKSVEKAGKEIYIPTKKKVTPLHVAIAGNIGSGKTTLTGLLSKNMKWEPHYETVDENPYLNDFYDDMQRWSFNLQIYFLNSRFQQVMNIRQSPKTIIQDRTIYEDAYIFAPNLHSMGLMTTRDFNNYQQLFESMAKFISPPDLLIYLRASVPALVNQIQKRGRDYENTIRLDYLKRLNERYEAWISNYELGKVLVIDIDHLNFAENPEDLSVVINKINAEIHGLF